MGLSDFSAGSGFVASERDQIDPLLASPCPRALRQLIPGPSELLQWAMSVFSESK